MISWIGASLAVLMILTAPTVEASGRIALSFDDAPRPDGPLYTGAERSQRLMQTLAETGVEGALFFVTTSNLEQTPNGADRLSAYVENGHYLGNHSHSHLWLWRTEVAEYLADLDRASHRLNDFAGYQPYYRFPFLDEGRSREKRDAIRQALIERGLKNGYVTVDNYDWYMNALLAEAVQGGVTMDEEAWCDEYTAVLGDSVTFYDGIARDTLGRSPAHVLLLHENDYAALCIGELISALRSDGWEIIPAPEAYQDPIADEVPQTLFNGQGRVAAIAHESGRSPRSLIHVSEDEDWLRRRYRQIGLLSEAQGAQRADTTPDERIRALAGSALGDTQGLFGVDVVSLEMPLPRLASPTDAGRASLDRDVAAIVAEEGVVTAGVGLIVGGELVWAGYYGMERDGVPTDAETRFNIASITKSVTAETILRLHDQGKVDIDAPMSAHFVDPDLEGDPRIGGLTARVALTHRTGFLNWRFHEDDGVLRFNFDPGSEFGYSGEGFHYLAEWASAATGTPWPDLVRATTLAPLGLEHVRVGKTDAIVDTTAHPKTEDGSWVEPWCWPWQERCREDGGHSAADDMAITVEDYAVFLASALRGDGYSQAMVRDRNTVQGTGEHKTVDCAGRGREMKIPTDSGCPDAQGYGLGYQILDYGDYHVIGHDGGDWHEVTLGYGYDDTLDGVIVFLSGAQENAVRAMPRIIDRLDPNSPMSEQYWRHLENMEAEND